MNEQLYRCGWCGSPTDENGFCITIEEANTLAGDWDKAILTYGDCCVGRESENLMREAWEREMHEDAYGGNS